MAHGPYHDSTEIHDTDPVGEFLVMIDPLIIRKGSVMKLSII